MGPITLNLTAIPQPNTVRENPDQVQTDQVSISGSRQRDRMGKKNKVDLTWNFLTRTQAAALVEMFETGTVVYYNSLSSDPTGELAFTGLATYEQDAYLNSGDPLVRLSATIVEV